MDPNQNTPNPEMPVTEPSIIPNQQNAAPVQNVQPVAAEPVVQQPIEAVAQPTVQNVVSDVQPPITAQPQQENAQPAIPSNPTVVAPLGVQPQVVNDSNPTPIPVKKSKFKLLIIIAIAVVVLAGTAVSAWFFAPNLFYSGLPLKEYSTDKFSVLMPESYMSEAEYHGNSGAYFRNPGQAGDTNTNSAINVSYSDDVQAIPQYQQYINQTFDKSNEEIINGILKSADSNDNYSVSDIKISRYSRGSAKVYEMSAKVSTKADTNIYMFYDIVYFIDDKRFATINVSSDEKEPKMELSAHRIIDSFNFK